MTKPPPSFPPLPLSELQSFVHWIVTDPRGPEAVLRSAPQEVREKLGGRDWRGVIAPRKGLSDTRRLDVYAGGYPTRMFEALSEMFPSVKRVLGDKAFLSLTGRYVLRHPSREYSLSAVGEQLPEYLGNDLLAPDPLVDGLPFLPDLAALDRAATRAFHAWAEPPLDPQALASIDPEKLGDCRFRFQPETVLMESRWPVATIRELRDAPDSEFKVQVENSPERFIVHRSGYDVVVRKLDRREFAALKSLSSGETVWRALETAGAAAEGVELPVADWFRIWVSSGMFYRVE